MYNPFKKKYTPEEIAIFDYLANIRIFERLEPRQLHYFIPHLYERRYKQNEVIFFRGDPSHALYLIREGRVALNIDINESFEKLTEVGTGAAIGESCLLKKTTRQLNAIVTSESAGFFAIPQDGIFEIFDTHPKVKVKMLESLAEIYNQYNETLFGAYKASLGFFNLGSLYSH